MATNPGVHLGLLIKEMQNTEDEVFDEEDMEKVLGCVDALRKSEASNELLQTIQKIEASLHKRAEVLGKHMPILQQLPELNQFFVEKQAKYQVTLQEMHQQYQEMISSSSLN